MYILPTCLYVCIPGVCLVPTEEGIRSLGIGATDACKPPGGCWEPNPELLQGQQVS